MLPVLVELISGGRGHRDTLQSDRCYNRGSETGCRNPEEEKPLLAWGLRKGAVDMIDDGLACRHPSLPPQGQGCLLRFASKMVATYFQKVESLSQLQRRTPEWFTSTRSLCSPPAIGLAMAM